MTDLSKYICTNPFKYSEITVNGQHMCCNEWMNLDIDDGQGLVSSWNSDLANQARESMLDGSFKFCNKDKCPHLSKVAYKDRPSGPVIEKTDEIVQKLKEHKLPNSLKIVFDDACNLACPSCRVDFIRNSPKIYNKSTEILKQMDESYGRELKFVSLSGYGDPFYSTALFEWMCNFDKNKYPNMEVINIHTNAMLWNKLNWDKIQNIHPYVKSAEISIDAATPDTYHVVRKGGKWDLLIRNLEFISTIKTVDFLNFSFVVQSINYKEIVLFYDLITSMFKDHKNIGIHYYKILDWGILPHTTFKEYAVWEPTHSEYNELIKYVRELDGKNDDRVHHNLHNLTNRSHAI